MWLNSIFFGFLISIAVAEKQNQTSYDDSIQSLQSPLYLQNAQNNQENIGVHEDPWSSTPKCPKSEILLKFINILLEFIHRSPDSDRVKYIIMLLKVYLDSNKDIPESQEKENLLKKIKDIDDLLLKNHRSLRQSDSELLNKHDVTTTVVFKKDLPNINVPSCKESFSRLIETAEKAYREVAKFPQCQINDVLLDDKLFFPAITGLNSQKPHDFDIVIPEDPLQLKKEDPLITFSIFKPQLTPQNDINKDIWLLLNSLDKNKNINDILAILNKQGIKNPDLPNNVINNAAAKNDSFNSSEGKAPPIDIYQEIINSLPPAINMNKQDKLAPGALEKPDEQLLYHFYGNHHHHRTARPAVNPAINVNPSVNIKPSVNVNPIVKLNSQKNSLVNYGETNPNNAIIEAILGLLKPQTIQNTVPSGSLETSKKDDDGNNASDNPLELLIQTLDDHKKPTNDVNIPNTQEATIKQQHDPVLEALIKLSGPQSELQKVVTPENQINNAATAVNDPISEAIIKLLNSTTNQPPAPQSDSQSPISGPTDTNKPSVSMEFLLKWLNPNTYQNGHETPNNAVYNDASNKFQNPIDTILTLLHRKTSNKTASPDLATFESDINKSNNPLPENLKKLLSLNTGTSDNASSKNTTSIEENILKLLNLKLNHNEKPENIDYSVLLNQLGIPVWSQGAMKNPQDLLNPYQKLPGQALTNAVLLPSYPNLDVLKPNQYFNTGNMGNRVIYDANGEPILADKNMYVNPIDTIVNKGSIPIQFDKVTVNHDSVPYILEYIASQKKLPHHNNAPNIGFGQGNYGGLVNNNMFSPNLNRLAGANLLKLTNLPNKAGVIELTYVLKRPKPLIYQPIYYVKYRLPYSTFLQNYQNLLSRKPALRTEPTKLYQELIALSNVTDVSPALQSYEKDEILKLVFDKGSLVKAKLIGGTDELLKEQLEIIRNLNTDIEPNIIKNLTDALIVNISTSTSPRNDKIPFDDKDFNEESRRMLGNLLESYVPSNDLNKVPVDTEKPVTKGNLNIQQEAPTSASLIDPVTNSTSGKEV